MSRIAKRVSRLERALVRSTSDRGVVVVEANETVEQALRGTAAAGMRGPVVVIPCKDALAV